MNMTTRRVVVTGIGLVCPLANGANQTWNRLIKGESGIKAIDHFDVSDLPAKIAGLVPNGSGEEAIQNGLFDPDFYMDPKEQKRAGKFIVFAMAAADQALKDSGWKPQSEEEQERTGVIVGSGIGGLSEIYDTSTILNQSGARRVSPFFIPSSLINLASGHISIKHGLKGPNHSVVTACSTGAHAIGDASRLIAYGDADVMVAGGTEASVCRIAMAGFASARALSTSYNDTPTQASRPWDKGRDGFVMGEGAGVIILEEYEHAKRRGAHIYAEIIGYGLSGDAHHITAPASDGDGAYRAMKWAVRNAKVNPEEIGYVNAHGTSTPLGDTVELKAMSRLFTNYKDHLSVSSTKSSIGHLLGAAGSVEAIFSILALKEGILPPTLNLNDPDEEVHGFDLVPHEAREKKLKYAMSNSFGFGGTNATLIFKAV